MFKLAVRLNYYSSKLNYYLKGKRWYKIEIKAYPTEKIGPNVLFFVHGFGAESSELTLAHHRGVNDNLIIEDQYEDTFGSAAMHETIVNIRRV